MCCDNANPHRTPLEVLVPGGLGEIEGEVLGEMNKFAQKTHAH